MQFYVVYKDNYQYSEVFYSMERAQEYLYFVQTMEPKSNLHIESILEEETMTEKQEKYFNDLEEKYMAILEKEIRDTKERLEREGRGTKNFEKNALTLRVLVRMTMQNLGVKLLDYSTRVTFRARIDKNIQKLYLMGIREK